MSLLGNWVVSFVCSWQPDLPMTSVVPTKQTRTNEPQPRVVGIARNSPLWTQDANAALDGWFPFGAERIRPARRGVSQHVDLGRTV